MRETKTEQALPSTAKAIAVGVLIVGGYWALFGGITMLIVRPSEQTAVVDRLPPPGDPNGRAVNASLPLDRVVYNNITLVPVGDPVKLDPNKIGFIAQTKEGFGLWSEKPSGGSRPRAGGGGGPNVPRILPGATGPVYLRTTDGRWLQVVQRE